VYDCGGEAGVGAVDVKVTETDSPLLTWLPPVIFIWLSVVSMVPVHVLDTDSIDVEVKPLGIDIVAEPMLPVLEGSFVSVTTYTSVSPQKAPVRFIEAE
jgi:hypothetical protein